MPLKLARLHAKLSNKKILILGFGKEGRSTFNFLKKSDIPLSLIYIADQNPALSESEYLKDFPREQLISGENYLNRFEEFDLVIKTPGISLKSVVLSENIQSRITSQTELFLEFFGAQVIAVTGTKGKSTTSTLIHHILNTNGRNAIIAGNLGFPMFDYLESVTPDQKIVLELSSHQLQYCRFSPHVGVLLDIFPEHLDHYNSFEEYGLSKWNILKNQKKEDIAVLPLGMKNMNIRVPEEDLPGTIYWFSIEEIAEHGVLMSENHILKQRGILREEFDFNINRLPLQGMHNLMNIGAAIMAVEEEGLLLPEIMQAVQSFNALPHRMEWVCEKSGIIFYNDSIATIPEASIAAVETLKSVDTLILGGFNRGLNYNDYIHFLAESGINHFILLGEVGQVVGQGLMATGISPSRLFPVENLHQAVDLAFQLTGKGYICLLSPAAASYDQFRNFEERGNRYKQAIFDYIVK